MFGGLKSWFQKQVRDIQTSEEDQLAEIKFVPHPIQKFASPSLSLPHCGHFISSQDLFHPNAIAGDIKM